MRSSWRALCAIIFICLAGISFAQTSDSTSVAGAGALTPSNCRNLAGTWYAAGQVPPGYYKQTASPYDCKPIPACPGNQFFNTGAESCQCSSGTSWDAAYGTCHTPCGGGTAWNGASCASICAGGQVWNGASCACPTGSNWNGSSCATCAAGTSWNGSSCVSICMGGQTWNGSACACPSGQVWNGSTCGSTPNVGSFTMNPASQTVGSSFTLTWNVAGASTLSVTCTGANPAFASLSPLTSGLRTLVASKAGSTTCAVTASNPYGSDTATDSASAVCPSGTSWNGSSCASACLGGQSWNGSACVCPSGQTWSGSACGVAPAFTNFTVSPTSLTVGLSYTVGWGTTGTGPMAVTLNCGGAAAAYYTLSPSSGGTGSLASGTPGSTTCVASASNAWGSVNVSAPAVTAVCPIGTSWTGSTCAPDAPPPASQPSYAGNGFPVATCDDSWSWTRVDSMTGTWHLDRNTNGKGSLPAGAFMDWIEQDWTWNGSAWVKSGGSRTHYIYLKNAMPATYCY